MTDLERLKELLTAFGVGFTEELDMSKVPEYPGGSRIVCSRDDANVRGYYGFYTEFVFDAAGKFVSMGAWE